MRFNQRIISEKEIKIDLKDKKILALLSENARLPNTIIAKQVGLSKDSVRYRINNLEKQGLIQGYLVLVNLNKLGYNTYHLFLQLNQLNKEVTSTVVRLLKSNPYIKAVIEIIGKYNFEVSIAAKDISELDLVVNKIIKDLSSYLKEYELLIISKNYINKAVPRSFLHLKEENLNVKKKTQEGSLDKTDLLVLKQLSLNATIPLFKLAEMTRTSSDTISYRIKRMQEAGIIQKFSPIISYSNIGYTVYFLLLDLHNLDEKKDQQLGSFLKFNKNVIWASKTIGKFNVIIYLCVKRTEEFYQTMIELKEHFSPELKDYEILMGYEEHYYTYFPKICWE
ncbi:MAG: Lrp/AsnC family transcriptional regulator [Candidatus Woesearchaeota archaeon]